MNGSGGLEVDVGTHAQPEDVRPLLAAVVGAAVLETRVFLLASGSDGDWTIERLKMTEALAGQFAQSALDFVSAHGEDQLVGYSAGRTVVGGEAAVMPVTAVPDLRGLLDTMEGDVIDVPDFASDGKIGNGLRLYVVSLQLADQGWIHGIRVKSMRALRPTRSRKVAAFWNGTVYDDLSEDPLVFDDSFDAVVLGTQVVVFGQRNFERGLGFLEAARAEAEAVLRSATANLPISNLDALIAAARTDVNMLSKLRGIATKMQANPAYASSLTMANVIAFQAVNPGIALDIVGPVGAEALEFHPEPARRWQILKLLDDDYLHSQLTNLDYESNSKDLRS